MLSRERPTMLDASTHSLRLQGARRLLLAVLQEAIGTFQLNADTSDRRGRAAFTQVDAWFASEETESVFSFVSICDALGLEATYVRAGLRRWRDARLVSLEAGWRLEFLSSPGLAADPEREDGSPVPSRPYRGSSEAD
jgi:hypothetical protein